MSEHIAKMKPWLSSLAGDIDAIQALVAEPKLARDARLLGSAALSYLITRLDLIPDWEETAGTLDDTMVLRVAMALASEHDLDPLEDDAQRVVHKMANENELVREFLGDELYAKLKSYVAELVNVTVRGRHPRVAIDDEKAREQLFAEVKDELKRLPQTPMKDPDAIGRLIKNHLSHKLNK